MELESNFIYPQCLCTFKHSRSPHRRLVRKLETTGLNDEDVKRISDFSLQRLWSSHPSQYLRSPVQGRVGRWAVQRPWLKSGCDCDSGGPGQRAWKLRPNDLQRKQEAKCTKGSDLAQTQLCSKRGHRLDPAEPEAGIDHKKGCGLKKEHLFELSWLPSTAKSLKGAGLHWL